MEAAFKKLEADGVIKPVQFSQWAAPIVPVLKPDGSVRICDDYKVTLNQAAKTDTYPLPKIEDLFTSLCRGKLFSKMDLASAYLQIPLEEESKEYTTINTHKESRLTIVSCEAKKKHSNATTELVTGVFTHSTALKLANALAKPPLKLSLSYY